MSYISIRSPASAEVTIKKSRFIGRAFPVSTEAEIQAILQNIRKENWDARHHCYAYRLLDSGYTRFSDDGEPSGTAGKPILDVLTGAGLSDVLIVVTRYFGGILLGTGGLARAYAEAAGDAIACAEPVDYRDACRFSLPLDYSGWTRMEKWLRGHADLESVDYGAQVTVTCWVEKEMAEDFKNNIVDLLDGKFLPEETGAGLHSFSASGKA